jgi:hypothetical protein
MDVCERCGCPIVEIPGERPVSLKLHASEGLCRVALARAQVDTLGGVVRALNSVAHEVERSVAQLRDLTTQSRHTEVQSRVARLVRLRQDGATSGAGNPGSPVVPSDASD